MKERKKGDPVVVSGGARETEAARGRREPISSGANPRASFYRR